MPNPLIQMMINAEPKKEQNISSQPNQIVEAFKLAKDPQAILKNNPQLQQILAMYKGDAKSAFYSLCQQKGVNPEDILKQFR